MLGSDGVAPEMGRVVVAFVQRMSDDRPLAASNPFAQQRRLAKAGRGRNGGQFVVQAVVQPLDQVRARDELRSGGEGYRVLFAEEAFPLRMCVP
jgi:hypothetical protein